MGKANAVGLSAIEGSFFLVQTVNVFFRPFADYYDWVFYRKSLSSFTLSLHARMIQG